MGYILCYTKPGTALITDNNYPGHTAYACDWEQSMHMAWSVDGKNYHPLRNDTGVLFPLATFDEGNEKGTTKTLSDPWLYRSEDGEFMVCAIRRNQNAPDSRHVGCIQVFSSSDAVCFREIGFLHVSDTVVSEPTCHWDADRACYTVTWLCGDKYYQGITRDFIWIADVGECAQPPKRISENDIRIEPPCQRLFGNAIEVSDDELKTLRMYLDEIHHVAVEPIEKQITSGTALDAAQLPKAVCRYSDGSTHEKLVDWDKDAIAAIDFNRAGTYTIPGRIRPSIGHFPFELSFGSYAPSAINDPNMATGMSDPCVTYCRGKYYLSSSGNQNITLRCADTIEGVFSAEPVVIHQVKLHPGERMCGTWAAELHEIGGSLYLLTSLCRGGDWTTVQSAMLRCHGDPLDPCSWEEPKLCMYEDGSLISERGISLDMTYFEDGGRHYVMWSNRFIYEKDGRQAIEPAEIDIATVSPDKPWILHGRRVCISRPDYGWDRFETEVDEGPYILRHGDDLFITISGSSTGMGELYNVGLLRAKSGTDLLKPSSWSKLPYPLLTKESAPGEYGPGHNNFVVDRRTNDTVMVYHAIPHAPEKMACRRQPGIRRLHFAVSGLPYLEMTSERDLKPELADITMQLTIE